MAAMILAIIVDSHCVTFDFTTIWRSHSFFTTWLLCDGFTSCLHFLICRHNDDYGGQNCAYLVHL